MATVTRADLSKSVLREIGLSRRESAEIVDSIIEAIADRLEAGEVVKISGFGTFTLRDKGERLGRNPKTRAGADLGTAGGGVQALRCSEEADGRGHGWYRG